MTTRIEYPPVVAPFILTSNSTGTTWTIDQNDDTTAFNIDVDTATYTAWPVVLNYNGGETLFYLGNSRKAEGTLYLKRNVAAASSSGPVATIINDNASDDQPSLKLEQAAPFQAVDVATSYTGNTYGLKLTNGAASSATAAFRWLNSISRYGLVLGNGSTIYRLWVDDTGDLRINGGDPVNHDDGTVVGTQS